MKTIQERIRQLEAIISECGNHTKGKLYYMGRRDEMKRLLNIMKDAKGIEATVS